MTLFHLSFFSRNSFLPKITKEEPNAEFYFTSSFRLYRSSSSYTHSHYSTPESRKVVCVLVWNTSSSSSSSCSLDQNQFNSWLIRQQIWERKSVKEYFDEFDRFIVASLYKGLALPRSRGLKGQQAVKNKLKFWSHQSDSIMIVRNGSTHDFIPKYILR